MDEITIIPEEKVVKHRVSLAPEPKPRKVHYKVEQKEVSEGIKKFDQKLKRRPDSDPYSFNAVSLKKKDVPVTQTAQELIAQPTYNTMGKFLGIDTVHDWNRYYDKVHKIVEWAKIKSGTDDISKLIKWVSDQSRRVPSMGQGKRIDELYLFAKLQLNK